MRFQGAVRLPNFCNFFVQMHKWHGACRLKQGETVRQCFTRLSNLALVVRAGHLAFGQKIEHLGYAVDHYGQLLCLTNLCVARTVYSLAYIYFFEDERFRVRFPLPLSAEDPDALGRVTQQSLDKFNEECDKANVVPRTAEAKKGQPRAERADGGAVQQSHSFSATEDKSQRRGRSMHRAGGRAAVRNESTGTYTSAAERVKEQMRTAKTMEAKDDVFRRHHKETMDALGPKAKELFRNMELNNTGTPLLHKKKTFLQGKGTWSPSGFRLLMLYKDICGAPRKDLAYDSVKGLDDALKEWRQGSQLASWLRSECAKAYKPIKQQAPSRKANVNVAAAEEPDSGTSDDDSQ